MGVLEWIDGHQGLMTTLVVACAYADFRFATKPLLVRVLTIAEAVAALLPAEQLQEGEKVARAEIDATETRAAGAVLPILRVIRGGPAVLLAVAVTLASLGCVQASFWSNRCHQDVARTTSSTQTADAAIDVPVSLVPK